MPMTPELSNKIANMSLLCAFMVVGVHMAGSETVGDVTWWIEQIFGYGLFAIAVPFFFVVSGYFVGRSYAAGKTWREIVGKRLHSLVIPFILWNLIVAVLLMGLITANDMVHGRAIGTNIACHGWHWLSLVGLYPFSEPFLGPLWYVRGLFIIVLVSPLLLKLRNGMGLVTLYVLMYLTMALPGEKSIWYHFFRWTVPTLGLFYFTVGLFLAHRPLPLKHLSGCALLFVVGLGILAVNVYCKYHGIVPLVYFRAFMIPFVLPAVWSVVPTGELPPFWRGMAFPIYVLHYIIISLTFFVSHSTSLPWYLFRGVCAIVGSVLVAHALRHVLPRFSRIVMGGRG